MLVHQNPQFLKIPAYICLANGVSALLGTSCIEAIQSIMTG